MNTDKGGRLNTSEKAKDLTRRAQRRGGEKSEKDRVES
jgi:hypothetical protein